MAGKIITLTTDFGDGSAYVAEMKGVLLTLNPDPTLIDITHAVPPQNIRQGALVLASATPRFPAGTIHVAVVDPGVGTQRRLIYARFGEQHYVAPDNGLLSGLAATESASTIVELTDRQYWSPETSATFHGRDILAPVAAHLSLGLDPARLGTARGELVQLDWPEARVLANRVDGEVISVDSFGNLITNITSEMLEGAPTDERLTVTCDEHQTLGLFRAYGDQPEMTLIALIGSSARLELAIVNENAQTMLGVGVGEKVIVRW